MLGKPRTEDWPKLAELPHWAHVQMWPAQGYADQLAQRLAAAHPGAAALSLLRRLLRYDPDQRATADAALSDPYFEQVSDDDLPPTLSSEPPRRAGAGGADSSLSSQHPGPA